jgi:hypothetical protein
VQRAFATTFSTPRALTQIDGIDIYESARLESEGISDIPSLAKSDLVSMMVNTRMPVERLVDWSDQAMLVLLVDEGEDRASGDGDGEKVEGRDGEKAEGQDGEARSRISHLRSLGIRTASSLAGRRQGRRSTGPVRGRRRDPRRRPDAEGTGVPDREGAVGPTDQALARGRADRPVHPAPAHQGRA